jgi:hypothetical protein
MAWQDLTPAEQVWWTREAFAGMAEWSAEMNDMPAGAGEGEEK